MLLPGLGLTGGHQNAHKFAHGRHSGGLDSRGYITGCTTQICQLPRGSSGPPSIRGPSCAGTLLLVTTLSGATEPTAAESRNIDGASASSIVSIDCARATGGDSARAGPAHLFRRTHANSRLAAASRRAAAGARAFSGASAQAGVAHSVRRTDPSSPTAASSRGDAADARAVRGVHATPTCPVCYTRSTRSAGATRPVVGRSRPRQEAVSARLHHHIVEWATVWVVKTMRGTVHIRQACSIT